MSSTFKSEVRKRLKAAEATGLTAAAKGGLFEQLLVYIFDELPATIVEPDIISSFGTEQVDIAVSNRGAFPSLPSVFLVECKNYRHKLDSKAVGYFLFICLSRKVELAVIVASDGLTGDSAEQTYAKSLAKAASPLGCKLIVLDRDDLLSFTTPDDVILLLERRYLRAFASGGIGVR